MRILFFSHYFTPEGNAPASRTYENRKRWVRAGHEVTVISDYEYLNPGQLKSQMRKPVFFDTRNLVQHDEWREAGFQVKVLGSGRHDSQGLSPVGHESPGIQLHLGLASKKGRSLRA